LNVSRVRGGEAIRRAACRIHKFKGRDFLLWNLASLLNRSWPQSFAYTDARGLKFLLDLNDPAYRALYLFGQYEWDLLWTLDNLLAKAETFVEAGTSIGLYTAIAARSVGRNGKVLGFEPLNSARETAERHVRLNALTNVSIAPYALGTAPGTAEIFDFFGLPTGHASLANLAPDGAPQKCEVATLDSLLSEGDRSHVRLIKLDVEGSEFAALKGADATIDASHPRIIIECNTETAAAFGYSFAEVERWCHDRAYVGFVWRAGRWVQLPSNGADTMPHNVLFVWHGDCDALRRVRAQGTEP